MVRNDYRRALILLRAMQPGMNGHVRLERRTLMGSMQFTLSGLQADGGTLQAVMAGRTASGWKLVHIGTLGSNSRGQAGLHWTFDPRSIDGLPLEKYSVLLVLQSDGRMCRTLFTGYVNGSVAVDWEQVERVACQEFTETEMSGERSEMTRGVESDGTTDAGAQPDMEQDPKDAEQEHPAEETPVEPTPDESASAASAMAVADAIPVEPLAAVFVDPLDIPARQATAMETLGLNASERWPESIEPLREVFAQSEPVSLPAQPDHVFVRAEHAPDCPECIVGVRADKGVPASVAYAIPGEYGDRPPAGLEGYTWKDGYWIVVADAQTGEYLNI